jgi:hypothetical protein
MIRRRRTATALTAAAALALGVLPAAFTASSLLATAPGPTTLTPGAVSAGSVVLSTTSEKGTISWNGQTQEITGGQQCEVTSSGASLLKITGSVGEGQSGVAGFRDGDIGVFEASAPASSPNNAAQCFRVDSGSFTETESLTLALHPDGAFSDAPFADRLHAGSASIDARVANSRDGVIAVKLLDASGTVLKQTPATWTNAKSGSAISIPTTALTIPGGTFDAVRLTATSGSFSVRGATLNLLSQAEQTFCPNDTITDSDGAGASVTYLGSSSGACYGVTLYSTDTQVRFLKPKDVAPDAYFKLSFTWTLLNPGGTPSVTLPETAIDFEVGTTNLTDLPFCEGYVGYTGPTGSPILVRNSAGDLTVADFEAFSNDARFADFEPDSPEKEFACIDARTSEVTAEQFTVNDTSLVVGDLKVTPR